MVSTLMIHLHKLCRWIRLAACFGVWWMATASPLAAQDVGSFEDILARQYARHPQMALADLYKFIHQAALGSEHAVADTAMARRWMDDEIATLSDGLPEPLLDPLTPDGRLARVHLRPYLAEGGSPEDLLQAFVQTANTYHGSKEQLRAYWQTAETMAEAGDLPFPPDTMAVFIARMAEAGYPAVHHSDAYNEAYHPAYRVVAVDLLPGLNQP